MNVLKTLFNTTAPKSNFVAESLVEMSQFPDIQPLWANLTEIQATVTQTIAPQVLGRVKFRGTRWRAVSDRPYPLAEGTVVQVVGRHRTNILIVQPVNPSAS